MGFNLIILGMNEKRLNSVEHEIKSNNPLIEVKIIRADLSGDAEKVTEEVVK